MVWVASTSRTWLVPIPKAIAPNAPCIDLENIPCYSGAGLGDALFGSYDVYDPLFSCVGIKESHIIFRTIFAELFDHSLSEWITLGL